MRLERANDCYEERIFVAEILNYNNRFFSLGEADNRVYLPKALWNKLSVPRWGWTTDLNNIVVPHWNCTNASRALHSSTWVVDVLLVLYAAY